MKKALLLIGVISSIMSCHSTNSRNSADSSKTVSEISKKNVSANNLEITLNGIDSTVANHMQAHFVKYKDQDKSPIQKSVWFDSATFRHMVNLLTKERGPEHAGTDNPGQTDGIRIYFVSDTSVSSGKLNNSIILVSTKNNGPDKTVPSGAKHADYYTHLKNDPLFKDTSIIHGLPATRPRFPVNTYGENLYNPILRFLINEDGRNNCDGPHYISRGKGNKMVNQYGKDAISTISEWFDLKLLKTLALDNIHDGIRIYFSRHPAKYRSTQDTDYKKEAFVFITTKYHYNTRTKTVHHNDYFDCETTMAYFSDNKQKFTDWNKRHPFDGGGGNDNGEICPTHCP